MVVLVEVGPVEYCPIPVWNRTNITLVNFKLHFYI